MSVENEPTFRAGNGKKSVKVMLLVSPDGMSRRNLNLTVSPGKYSAEGSNNVF